MLPLTRALLFAQSELVSEGYLVFGVVPNALGTASKEAILSHFGPRATVVALSGNGSHELMLSDGNLRELDPGDATRALAELLQSEARMYASGSLDAEAAEGISKAFFNEMPGARIYGNMSVRRAGSDDYCPVSWNPVTRHSMDSFICAVTDSLVGYWLCVDDE